MDASVKQLLKDAKEAVKQKNYDTGLNYCKEILQREKTNYLALVLSAVCFQETGHCDKALAAFQKATDLQPDQPSAWQGLVAFLEKKKEEANKTLSTDGESLNKEQSLLLSQAYQKLLTFYTNDWTKYSLVSEKLAVLSLKAQNTVSAVNVLKTLLQKAKDNNSETNVKEVWGIIANLLFQREDLPAEDKPMLIEALKNSIDATDSSLNEAKWSKLVTLLPKDASVIEAEKLLQVFPHSPIALHTLSCCYVEKFAQNESLTLSEVQSVADHLPKENSASINGVLASLKNEILEAKKFFKIALQQEPNNPVLYKLLFKMLIQALLYKEAAQISQEWLALDKSNMEAQLAYVKACVQAKTPTLMEEAEKIALEVLARDPKQQEAVICLTRIRIKQQDAKEARALLEELKTFLKNKSLDVQLLEAECLEAESFVLDAIKVLEEDEDQLDLPSLLFLAQCQEKALSWKASANTLVKAAKLYPYAGEVYLRLGLLLWHKACDTEKGLRCLQKALALAPTDMKIAKTLSDSYQAINDIENHISLLKAITQLHGTTWAWLRLGLLQLQKGDVSQSVFSLQNAVRTQPNDGLYWEALADAYIQRGSFTAALKAFQKAAELLESAGKPTAYPDLQIAYVYQVIGELDEALKRYESVLAKNASDLTLVPALRGMAETLIVQAQQYLQDGRPGCALDNVQVSITHLTRAVEVRPDLSCLWASLGQSCLLLRDLAKESVTLTVSSYLFTDNVNLRSVSDVVLDKKAVMRLGARMFCKAIKLQPTMSALWHNLALAYYQQIELTSESLQDQERLYSLAEAAARKAVTISPQEPSHWHALGQICAERNPSLAQHAWITCLQKGKEDGVHRKDPVAWTNLGALYMHAWKTWKLPGVDMTLAHRAFQQAQHDQPDYTRAWVGQAMIAESFEHGETMDLFRHTVLLQGSSEGAIGYAHHVLKTVVDQELKNTPHYVYSIEKMNAVVTASDAMIRYLGERQSNPCAYNFLGLLLERQRLFRQAETYFRRALELLQDKQRQSEEEGDLREQVQTNLARVLNALGKHETAVETYSALSKSEFYAACGLGLAHYKAKHPEDASATYEAALEWLVPDEASRSHLLVALAAMAIKTQNYEKAQNLLFESCSIEPASIHGIFALASLGLLQSDETLTEAALSELKPHLQNPVYLPNIAFLLAAKQVTTGNNRGALKEWARAIHARPDLPSLWYHVCVHLAQQSSLNEAQSELLWRCASKAAHLGLASPVQGDVSLSQAICLASLGHLRSHQPKLASRLAQKAIHMAPHEPQGWMCLLAADGQTNTTRPLATSATALAPWVTFVKSLVTGSKACLHWLRSYEKMAL